MSFEAPDEGCAELLDLARSVVRGARDGEQLEAIVGRSSYTTVRAHGGEIESFTSATSAAIGVRVSL